MQASSVPASNNNQHINPNETPEKPASSSDAKKTVKHSLKLFPAINEKEIIIPVQVIEKIDIILKHYLDNKVAPSWIRIAQLVKSMGNAGMQYVLGANMFSIIPEDRKPYCDELIKNLKAKKNIEERCDRLIELGKKALIAYSEATCTYALFFMSLHTVRNILVTTIKKEYPQQYHGYIQHLVTRLSELEQSINDLQKNKHNTTSLYTEKWDLILELAYLEHDQSIRSAKEYGQFNQFAHPTPLSREKEDPSKPYFLQTNFGENFFNSAFKPILNQSFAEFMLEEKKTTENRYS